MALVGQQWLFERLRLFRRVVLRARDCVAGGRFAESAVVSGPGRDRGGAGPLDVVAHAAADRRGDARGGIHVGVGAARRRVGLVRGKTVGLDATTLEANAAMRSIERRDTGESYEAFLRRLAEASGGGDTDAGGSGSFRPVPEEQEDVEQGVEIAAGPGREGRVDEGRSDAPGLQGRARGRPGHGSHRLGDGAGCVGGRFGDAAGDADDGGRAGRGGAAGRSGGVEEVVADKGYHSDKTLVALDEIGVRSYVSEPERGRRCWQDKRTRGDAPGEACCAAGVVWELRRRIRGARGLVVYNGGVASWWSGLSPHQYETGGLRRVWVRGHDNVRKRVLIQAAGCNIGLLLRRLTGVGTPRSLQGRALSAIYGLIGRLIDRWGRLTSPWGSKWRPAAFVGSIAHRQAA